MAASPKVTTRKNLNSTVFVGNLDRETPEETLKALFEDCGEIVEIRLATNHAGERRPFAHIEFATPEAAAQAITKNGTEIEGEPLKVEAPRQDEYSKKTVYVCNLPTDVSKELLRPVFETVGTIKEIRIGNGYAHVEYEEEKACAQALTINGTEVGDSILTVEKAVRGRKRKRFGARFVRGGRGGRGGGRGKPVSKEALDADIQSYRVETSTGLDEDLDAYMAKAKVES